MLKPKQCWNDPRENVSVDCRGSVWAGWSSPYIVIRFGEGTYWLFDFRLPFRIFIACMPEHAVTLLGHQPYPLCASRGHVGCDAATSTPLLPRHDIRLSAIGARLERFLSVHGVQSRLVRELCKTISERMWIGNGPVYEGTIYKAGPESVACIAYSYSPLPPPITLSL
ncbi:hypothetical protein DAEQUDRAFT_731382 [Daedalea quercina L-15889]|uniref:Uncharacterized protein n=1 Tax=Daedalea quercina L-15889 TaxID=1314783 RepID=A0A165MB05_9APHY|nr:hypothetical protein DAEQUDRAFT_731382 [Daedalea quercina L-15889]